MKKYIRFLPALLFFSFMIAIILIADIKGTKALQALAPGIPHSDKLGHFIIFGMMGLFANIAFQFRTVKPFGKSLLLGSVIVMSFAICEECTQMLFPTRSFDFVDMACDLIGIGLFSSQFIRNKARPFIQRLTPTNN